jgi:transposase
MPTSKITTNDFSGQTFYVGLDVHKKSWSVTVRTSGLEIEHFTQTPDPVQLAHHLKSRFKGAVFYSAYEAGFSGTSAHTALCKAGINNNIIHPGDLPVTDKQKNNKTDLHDSRAIAKYLEADLLNSIYIMPVEQQERRSLFRLRQAKVKDNTRSANRLRGMINFFGIKLPDEFSDKEYISQNFIQWLKKLNLSTQQGTDTIQYYINELVYQRQQLLLITRQIRTAIKQYYQQQYECMLTVPGIGAVTAMGLLAETGTLSRFDNPNEFASYLGLIPSEHSSGETVYSKHIQNRCNRYLRPLLIEAAWQAIRKSPILLAYFKKHIARNNKKAIVKVARKLALIAKAVALSQTKYQEEYQAGKQEINHSRKRGNGSHKEL